MDEPLHYAGGLQAACAWPNIACLLSQSEWGGAPWPNCSPPARDRADELCDVRQEIMDKEQAMLLEELALFQSRLEGRPISTEEAMRLTIEQLVDSLFPVRRQPHHPNPR